MLPKDLFTYHTNIGLDLDETLAESVFLGIQSLHKMGKMLQIQTMEDIKYFELWNTPSADMTKEELHLFWKNQMLAGMFPFSLAKDAVSLFESLGKIPYVITARNETEHRDDTKKWLQEHFPTLSERTYFANHTSDDAVPKSLLCKRLGVTVFIDDAFHNAEDLVSDGITCILLEKPWNRDYSFEHPLLHRVKGWEEIIDNLGGYG